MSKLSIEQKYIKDLFGEKKADFLIPDYQRPYAWGEKECQTLWDDIFGFAFPDNDYEKFSSENDEYFLGPIVTFKNQENGKKEIIDGQQRLTTLLLLLRAFYERYGSMNTVRANKTREEIAKCIWKTNEFGDANQNELKITSEVATDEDKDDFLMILKTGQVNDKMKSRYASNYRYFQEKVQAFLDNYPDFFSYLPIRILNNCTLLPIEAGSQETALRIFSTLNDRGKPLSDADIFKAQFYKYFTAINKKEYFIDRWKFLEGICKSIFVQGLGLGTPLDEIFTRYMYYERALLGVKSSTTEALRKFYERDTYALLRKEETLNDLINLAEFWKSVELQDKDRFSDRILKTLFILKYAPNGMWTYFVSVYYMANKDDNGMLNEDEFYAFLNKTIGFVWAYAVINPGLNALRTPFFAEMINIVNKQRVSFADFKMEVDTIRNGFMNYSFNNNRAITKAMLTWWAFHFENQTLIPFDTVLEIEHVFPRNRNEQEKTLIESKNIESIGNKSLLEKRINIRASDYRFSDKAKYYTGFESKRGTREGTSIWELRNMANKSDFTERDIIARKNEIIEAFIQFLAENNLLVLQ